MVLEIRKSQEKPPRPDESKESSLLIHWCEERGVRGSSCPPEKVAAWITSTISFIKYAYLDAFI
jgi:hypothetical protein